jgi:hypothetical protein
VLLLVPLHLVSSEQWESMRSVSNARGVMPWIQHDAKGTLYRIMVLYHC